MERARPRVLLAWESGAGRGHIVTLKTVAQALGPSCVFEAALCRMDHAHELESTCDLVFPGAGLFVDRTAREATGVLRTATWGEFLGDIGFRDMAFLTRQVAWWKEVLTNRCIDLVVADYAPCALLAAQAMGIPSVAVGTGYGIPPEGLEEFPVFLPQFSQRIYDEGAMTAAINAALGPLGVPPLGRLPDIYRRSAELVRTLTLLDPYAGQRAHPLMPPVADVAKVRAGDGEEIFAYFSTTELGDEAVVEAVCGLGLPMRAFCPGASAETATRLAAAGIMLESGPVPVDLIARRSRLVIHSGQHGILSLALAAGLPQVALPQHLEQLYHAARCTGVGSCRTVTIDERQGGGLRAIIRQAYEDEAMRARAAALAEALRPEFAVDPAAMIRERITPLIG